MAEISTDIVTLHRKTFENATPATYIASYKARFESDGGPLVMPGTTTVLEQFRLISSLYFRSIFHPDRTHIDMLMRQRPRHSADQTYPSAFVDRYFEMPVRGEYDEVNEFSEFFRKVIGMRRKSYNLFISCLRTFFSALEACSVNFDLAYSMIAYCLEALSKSDDSYVPVWEDHPKRSQLDPILSNLDDQSAGDIRAALVKDSHLKLMGRFMVTINNLMRPSFFVEEAVQLARPLPKSELDRALKNLYKTRSGFVHSLSQVQEQLKHPGMARDTDYVTWSDEPHLTFSGLVRLAHHALMTFVEQQEVLETEDYPWRDEIEGVMQAELAPQFWMWQADNYGPRQSHWKLGGLISHLTHGMRKEEFGIPDLRPLMKKIETCLVQGNADEKLSMYAHYGIYNSLIQQSARCEKADQFIEKHSKLFEGEPRIQHLISEILVGGFSLEANGKQCANAFERYRREKYRKLSLSLPIQMEVAVMLGIANKYLECGETAKFREWLEHAKLDSGFDSDLQLLISAASQIEASLHPVRDVLGAHRQCVADSVTEWTFENQVREVTEEKLLQIRVDVPAIVRCSSDGWNTVSHFATVSNDSSHFAVLRAAAASRLQFTLFWIDSQTWEGKDFAVEFT